jgi:lipopolysaccharide assembly protein A
MTFLKTFLWVIFIIAMVIFAVNNWVPVSIKLWGGLLLDTKLPMLVIVSFLIGFVPLWLWHRATHWRMKRRIVKLENITLENRNSSPPLNMGKEEIAPPISPDSASVAVTNGAVI